MRRVFALALTIPLLLVLIEPTAFAKKRARSGRAAIHARRQPRRTVRRARGRRGRVATRARSRRRFVAEPIEATATPRPAPGIPTERVTEIQNALIKAGYMDGPPSGEYDEPTIEAMKQYQVRSGMRATGMPSAPALKKLGVSKRTNDDYAVPVTSVSETRKKNP
ncbi:MAG: peptidoglycan-binding domain-containing protein [Blastocatellia bacterium]